MTPTLIIIRSLLTMTYDFRDTALLSTTYIWVSRHPRCNHHLTLVRIPRAHAFAQPVFLPPTPGNIFNVF